MSNSRAKYEELREKPSFVDNTEQQKSVAIIVEILQASDHTSTTKQLLSKVLQVSKEGPNLSPATVFQIAADATKVDELCNAKTN
ncbi:hypothetical protein UFOVP54_170 [uncultured Caudovirales phage]|uniref:Uncharacterized protein n=1 Tax=uncultured Caudovirales phage TaxID=2100421 RepID=A0A6J5KUB5_9CAUD|nr:hypothetical protein UFOVP54_170 [uncultured Caudovirales phage]